MTRIEVWAPGVFRIRCSGCEFLNEVKTVFLSGSPEAIVAVDFQDSSESFVLETEAIRLTVRKIDGAMEWRDHSGGLLLRTPGNPHRLTPKRLTASRAARRATSMVATVDGQRAGLAALEKHFLRDAWSAEVQVCWQSGEVLMGLGSHEEGYANYRGRTQYLYQHNLKIPIPHLLSSCGYSLLFHTGSPFLFESTEESARFVFDAVDELDYFFSFGPGWDDLVARFRDLTGRASLLPRWALGYVQSKEHYKTQEELLAVAREHRRRGIPLDVLVQDWKYWPSAFWGEKLFDLERYPDPAFLCEELHRLGVRLMISIWPNMAPGGVNQMELAEGGFLLADNSTYNAFSDDARRAYWEQVRQGLQRFGVDAWWCDSAEPFTVDWEGQLRPDPSAAYPMALDVNGRFIDPTRTSAYATAHARCLAEGQARVSDGRMLNLIRSSYPGQQMYGAVAWSGDISARWDVFRKQITEGLHYCATGMPYWTWDVGGFFTGRGKCFQRWTGLPPEEKLWFWDGDYEDGCADLGYRELYVRWFQAAVFLPMFRAHGTDTPRELWQFGEPGSVFFDALLAAVRLRYRLLPYLYTEAWKVHAHHGSLLRALAFDFRQDAEALMVTDQFLCGKNLMVCPVLTPFLYGPDSTPLSHSGTPGREVYLPAGCSWYDFYTGECFEGGQRLFVVAELGRIPVFVREGTLLPTSPGSHGSDSLWSGVTVFPGCDAEGLVYLDAGEGSGHARGESARVRMSWNEKAQMLTIAPADGIFPGCPHVINLMADRIGPCPAEMPVSYYLASGAVLNFAVPEAAA